MARWLSGCLLWAASGAAWCCPYTPAQCANLAQASAIGKPYGLSATLQGLRLRESSAEHGRFIGDYDTHPDDPSLGPWQVRRSTAEQVMRAHPELGKLSRAALIHKLLYDAAFNGRIAALQFQDLRSRMSWREAVAAYNLGEAKLRELQAAHKDPTRWRYTQSVINYITALGEHAP